MVNYNCNHCHIKLETDDSISFRLVACPNCQRTNFVPLSKPMKQEKAKEAKQIRKEKEKQETERLRIIEVEPYDSEDDDDNVCPLRGDQQIPGPPCLHPEGDDVCYPHTCPLRLSALLIQLKSD